MQMKFSVWQKAALEMLVDRYEASKTYRGENRVTQRFSISPKKVFSDYDSDYANVDDVNDFECQMGELEHKGLLMIQWKCRVIHSLTANPQKWEEMYSILGRKQLRYFEKKQIKLYQNYLGRHAALDHFCQEQITRLEQGKKARFAQDQAEKILKLCGFILENEEEILERELSIAVLGDSKLWERKYRSQVCRLLRTYGDFDALLLSADDEKTAEKILLGEFHIVSNPSYVYFKGDAKLYFENGEELKLNMHMPVAFTEKTVEAMRSVQIYAGKVVTVENLTSFNRLENEDSFYIFLSGYHNQLKQRLLVKIYEENKTANWLHFGDIDPDGFLILEHLKNGTKIPFAPLHMELSYLKKYDAYTKPLEESDIQKAKSLLSQHKYSEILEYMLKTGTKLEQEIISWKERLGNPRLRAGI